MVTPSFMCFGRRAAVVEPVAITQTISLAAAHRAQRALL
jgi:hypothetical protein